MPDGTEGQEGQQQENQSQNESGANQQQNDGEKFDEARARALIDKLRPFEKEAGRLQREKTALEAKVAEFEKSKLTETERLQAERDDALKNATAAELRAKERAVRADVVIAAAKLKIVDPDAAHRLLDASAIEFDDAGDPKNIEKLLTDMVKTKPWLLAATQANSGNQTNGQRGNNQTGDTDDERRARLYGGGARSLLTPEGARNHGGGIFTPSEKT